ncbi:MAG: 50S ribosomal protein L30e [Candidatus Micrarchaeaceae archaeon]
MADLARDIRLAVDTGKVAIGAKETIKSMNDNSAKAIIIATKGKKDIIGDILHMCNVSGLRLVRFEGSSLELGAACGKPYSINALAIIDPGNSNILNETYGD